MEKILNLTQHTATEEQEKEGVVEPENKKEVQALLTFEEPPTHHEMGERADLLAKLAKEKGFLYVLIGGAPYFMPYLEEALIRHKITPLYAFSKRESIDIHREDGSVEKRMVFKHAGFIQGGKVIKEVAEECYQAGSYNMPMPY